MRRAKASRSSPSRAKWLRVSRKAARESFTAACYHTRRRGTNGLRPNLHLAQQHLVAPVEKGQPLQRLPVVKSSAHLIAAGRQVRWKRDTMPVENRLAGLP